MPKRSPKQRQQLKAIIDAKRRRALVLAYRLSPYVHAWQNLGLSQRKIVDALNECGTQTPAAYNPDAFHAPTSRGVWTLGQYQRLLRLIPEAQKKMTFWAKRNGKPHAFPFGKGAGLFAYPELAPRRAFNHRKLAPGEPKKRGSVEWCEWELAQRAQGAERYKHYLETLDGLRDRARWILLTEEERNAEGGEEFVGREWDWKKRRMRARYEPVLDWPLAKSDVVANMSEDECKRIIADHEAALLAEMTKRPPAPLARLLPQPEPGSSKRVRRVNILPSRPTKG